MPSREVAADTSFGRRLSTPALSIRSLNGAIPPVLRKPLALIGATYGLRRLEVTRPRGGFPAPVLLVSSTKQCREPPHLGWRRYSRRMREGGQIAGFASCWPFVPTTAAQKHGQPSYGMWSSSMGSRPGKKGQVFRLHPVNVHMHGGLSL